MYEFFTFTRLLNITLSQNTLQLSTLHFKSSYGSSSSALSPADNVLVSLVLLHRLTRSVPALVPGCGESLEITDWSLSEPQRCLYHDPFDSRSHPGPSRR